MEEHLGVRFVYEQESTGENTRAIELKLIAEALAELPGSLQFEIREAALNLDLQGLEHVAEKVRTDSSELADTLCALAADYGFDVILAASQAPD